MMKYLITRICLPLLVILLFTACKKESDNTAPAPGASSVKFNYSGASSGTFSSAEIASKVINSGQLITITATEVGTVPKTAFIILPANITAGEYTQHSSGTIAGGTFSFTAGIANSDAYAIGGHTAAGFVLKVTRADAAGIEGTFSGQMGNDESLKIVTLAEGRFSATY